MINDKLFFGLSTVFLISVISISHIQFLNSNEQKSNILFEINKSKFLSESLVNKLLKQKIGIKEKQSNLKLDLKGIYYLPRIIKASKLGDASTLKELIKILNENKIKVIKSNFFNPELTLKKGIFSNLKPNKLDLINIKNGIKSLNNLNPHNHVQGLVIKNNVVIKKETLIINLSKGVYEGGETIVDYISTVLSNNNIITKFQFAAAICIPNLSSE